jgi:hypothetical protein
MYCWTNKNVAVEQLIFRWNIFSVHGWIKIWTVGWKFNGWKNDLDITKKKKISFPYFYTSFPFKIQLVALGTNSVDFSLEKLALGTNSIEPGLAFVNGRTMLRAFANVVTEKNKVESYNTYIRTRYKNSYSSAIGC